MFEGIRLSLRISAVQSRE